MFTGRGRSNKRTGFVAGLRVTTLCLARGKEHIIHVVHRPEGYTAPKPSSLYGIPSHCSWWWCLLPLHPGGVSRHYIGSTLPSVIRYRLYPLPSRRQYCCGMMAAGNGLHLCGHGGFVRVGVYTQVRSRPKSLERSCFLFLPIFSFLSMYTWALVVVGWCSSSSQQPASSTADLPVSSYLPHPKAEHTYRKILKKYLIERRYSDSCFLSPWWDPGTYICIHGRPTSKTFFSLSIVVIYVYA